MNGASRVVLHQAVEQLPVRADIEGFHFETPDIFLLTPHTAYLQGTSSDAPFMLRRKWWRAEMQPYVAAEMQLAARALEPQVDTRLPRAGREADSTGGASKGCLHSVVGWPQAQLRR